MEIRPKCYVCLSVMVGFRGSTPRATGSQSVHCLLQPSSSGTLHKTISYGTHIFAVCIECVENYVLAVGGN